MGFETRHQRVVAQHVSQEFLRGSHFLGMLDLKLLFQWVLSMDAITDEDILDEILDRMSEGVIPWRKPWTPSIVIIGAAAYYTSNWPTNVRNPWIPFGIYNGLLLIARASTRGYRSNLWISSEVVNQLNAQILRSDRKPVQIRAYTEEGQESGKRYVYNVDQVVDCERALGLSFSMAQLGASTITNNPSQTLLDDLKKHGDLKIRKDEYAAYSPSWDYVMMPRREQFRGMNALNDDGQEGEGHYWATMWHEVIHWTGHSSRKNRPRHETWGDQKYAFEELVAELGAAFLCAHLGVKGEMQHESYLNSWLKEFQSQSKPSTEHPLFRAAKQASEAKDFVLNFKKNHKPM